MRLLSILAFCGYCFAACTGSSPVWTSSADRTSVASCVASASRGDTINVSSGSATWSSTIMLTKGIILSGAGVGNTVITSGSGAVLFTAQPDSTAIANSENIKITGFTFDGNNSTCNMLLLIGASGVSGTKPYKYFVIGNNKFQNGCTSGEGVIVATSANGDGQLRGVIYNNVFDRCNIILRIFSNNNTSEWANSAFNSFAYGTEDNLYFEDNTIQFSSSFSGDNPGWTETGQGGRIVMRYNTWNLNNATTPQEVWDIHGFQNWNGTPNSGQTASMIEEYYGNTLSNMGTYRWIDHRGTWGLFFNNILTGPGGNSIEIYGMSTAASCASDINPSPSNYTPVINNSYFFNNTSNGTNVLAVMDGGNPSSCTVAENANWWNYNGSCTASSCSAGIGQGTTPPTGTCTTGVGYWVASTPTATTSSSVIQNGHLYQCTATNAWTLVYTPYTYPHPLAAVAVVGSSTAGPHTRKGPVTSR